MYLASSVKMHKCVLTLFLTKINELISRITLNKLQAIMLFLWVSRIQNSFQYTFIKNLFNHLVTQCAQLRKVEFEISYLSLFSKLVSVMRKTR